MDFSTHTVQELDDLDRDGLMAHFAEDLPMISGEMGLYTGDISWRTGLDKERLSLIVKGKRKMKWSEYMSILFFLWDDEKGRDIVEKRGLFPGPLKAAMAMNRNAH